MSKASVKAAIGRIKPTMKLATISCFMTVAPLLVSCDKIGLKPTGGQDNALEAIKECSRINTSEYEVSKVLVYDDSKGMFGEVFGMNVSMQLPGSMRTIAIPINGILKASVDMSQLTAENVVKAGNKLTVYLPDPKIELTATKVNNTGIREKTGWMRGNFTDAELTKLQNVCRDSLIASIPKLGLIDNARENARRTLITLLSSMGFEERDITINFKTDANSLTSTKYLEQLVSDVKPTK